MALAVYLPLGAVWQLPSTIFDPERKIRCIHYS